MAPGPKLSRTSPSSANRGAASKPRDGGLVKFDDCRDEQQLPLRIAIRAGRFQALVDESFMRRMLIDDDEPVARLGDDVGVIDLRTRSAERCVERVGLRVCERGTHIGGRWHEGRALFGKARIGGRLPRIPSGCADRSKPAPLHAGDDRRRAKASSAAVALLGVALCRAAASVSFRPPTTRPRRGPHRGSAPPALAGCTFTSTSCGSQETNKTSAG